MMKVGYTVPEKDNNIFANLSDFNDYEAIGTADNIKTFLQAIEIESAKKNSAKFLNAYHCLEFAKRLFNFCKYFLLWTNIMPNIFYVPAKYFKRTENTFIGTN